MKKILAGALAVLALAAGSCSKSGNEAATTDGAFVDSLSTAFGNYVGADIAMSRGSMTPEQKEALLAAMRQVLDFEGNEYGQQGAVLGGQLLSSINAFEEREGVKMNSRAVYEGLRQIILRDSVGYGDAMMFSNEFMQMRQTALERERARRAAEAENAPEARQNRQVSADFVADLKSRDAAVQTTESGLSYKIENPGEEAHPDANSTVKVKYVGKHINGTEFDNSNGEIVTFNLRGVVPGFAEGIRLLGKGGKATLYIPGNLAYGTEGQPQAGIAPNELLIFDVELVDFN